LDFREHIAHIGSLNEGRAAKLAALFGRIPF
jgi:hypothetical protein